MNLKFETDFIVSYSLPLPAKKLGNYLVICLFKFFIFFDVGYIGYSGYRKNLLHLSIRQPIYDIKHELKNSFFL